MTVANAKIITNSLALAMGYVRGPWSVVRSPSLVAGLSRPARHELRTTDYGYTVTFPNSNVSDCRVSTRSSRAVPRGCAAADAAPALSVRGRLPRAGKRPPLILSLRSRPRRVRDAVRRQMRCGRCAWGCPPSTDRWARTRRVESLRPFSRARVSGGRSAWLAPDVLGRPRPALQ